MPDSDLSKKMYSLAERYPAQAVELREKADALDAAITAAYAEVGTKDDVKRMLGCWARARRLVGDISGEPLI